jgi:hypothetical protein
MISIPAGLFRYERNAFAVALFFADFNTTAACSSVG